MSIPVTLLTFNKRENSTLKPSTAQISGGSTLDCLLMDNTSLMNPTFKLNVGGNPVGFNYCYVPSFERYFFINDWTYETGFWYASCTCDVLASWKTEIGAGTHYILRSASAYDGSISDDMYPAKMSGIEEISTPVQGNPFSWLSDHSYILGIVGEAPSNDYQVGSLVYYHMDETALRYFVGWLMDNIDDWSGLDGEYSQGVMKALINPMQYIKSCIVMPVAAPPADSIHRPTSIRFGYYTCSMSGVGRIAMLLASSPMAYETDLITVPKHPSASTRGSYLNCQPFSEYTFHFGPFGNIPLDPMVLNRNDEIFMSLAYDLTSGICRCVLKGNDETDDILFNGSASVGVSINISQVFVDGLAMQQATTDSVFSMANSFVSGVAGVAMGSVMSGIGGLVGIAQAATTGIQDATRLSFPIVSGLSDGGSFLPYHDTWNIYLLFKYYQIVDENLTELGRPLCSPRQINTLSGYILCSGADAIIPGTHDEAQKVNNYLNSGFFYE